MSILVTGGAGYIGSHLCVQLLLAGYQVVVLDNFCTSKPQTLQRVEAITGMHIKRETGDIRDAQFVERVLTTNQCSAVIHLAALKSIGEANENPLLYYDVNVAGTINLLRAMLLYGVKTFVFSSSATVYGHPEKLPIDEHHPTSVTNPYGRTKLLVEDFLRDLYQADNSWKLAILRYFNPAGAHSSGLIGEDPNSQPTNLMPIVAQAASGQRDDVKVWGDDYDTPDGTGVRDYIHVEDLAAGHIKALEGLARPGCSIMNLGTGRGYSVLEVIKTFEEVSGRKISYQIGPRRQGDVAACYADPTFAQQKLNWTAQKDLRDMCRDAWNWQLRTS